MFVSLPDVEVSFQPQDVADVPRSSQLGANLGFHAGSMGLSFTACRWTGPTSSPCVGESLFFSPRLELR